MSTENQNRAPSAAELTDAELANVSGGDKATTKTTPKPTDKKTEYLTVTLEQPLVSSY
jgi:bacteriocin-like protein